MAAINADARVMEPLGGTLGRAQSDALIEWIEAHIEQHGFGLWALQLLDGGELIGLTGLNTVAFDARHTSRVDVTLSNAGTRYRDCWGGPARCASVRTKW